MVKKKGTATPDRYVVSFLDILGYSNIVSRNDIGRTKKLLEAVSEVVDKADEVAERLLNGAKSKGLDGSVIANSLGYRAFSDNIVVFCGLHPESDDQFDNLDNYLAIGAVLILQSWIQTTLLSDYDLLSRGGVAIGEFTAEKNFLFGKALVDAYNLEETAETPRIIVDRSVRDTFRVSSDKAGCGLKDWSRDGSFVTDTDGEIYIPYLVAGVHIKKMLSEGECTPSAQ